MRLTNKSVYFGNTKVSLDYSPLFYLGFGISLKHKMLNICLGKYIITIWSRGGNKVKNK